MAHTNLSQRDRERSHQRLKNKAVTKAKRVEKKEKTFFEKLGISRKTLVLLIAIVFVLASTAIYSMVGTGSYIKQRREQLQSFSHYNPDQFNYNSQQFTLGPDGQLVANNDGTDGQTNPDGPIITMVNPEAADEQGEVATETESVIEEVHDDFENDDTEVIDTDI